MNEFINSNAGMGYAGSAARAGWTVDAPQTFAEAVTTPRSFDLEEGSEAGKMKLVRCHYQIQDVAVDCADEPEFAVAAGSLWAVINTSVAGGAVTAVIGWTYNALTPELVGIRLYKLDADGGIVCDCRGSQVIIYG